MNAVGEGAPLERALRDAGRAGDRARRADARLGDRAATAASPSPGARPPDGGSAITGYRIYRGTASGGETLLTTVGNVTSCTDTAVANGTTYYYQVSAVNAVGEGSRSNERFATTPSSGDSTAPSTPTNMTTLLSGTTQVVIDWANATDNVGVTGYQVYRDGVLVATVAEQLVPRLGPRRRHEPHLPGARDRRGRQPLRRVGHDLGRHRRLRPRHQRHARRRRLRRRGQRR